MWTTSSRYLIQKQLV
ncbi:hypothetical protein NQ318_017418 [Aromia moschata]|uniref:Uncharacterized protein n=1 Tax=Aromia moschata TaxID=1265417 RepID=A0AAV8Z515_9CUCU|nr:hypothetical protein NQ318_012203 [Aromia moschata]KAJ8958274.1 hypothetical protein NQ318_017418 [Aromia moschata]